MSVSFEVSWRMISASVDVVMYEGLHICVAVVGAVVVS